MESDWSLEGKDVVFNKGIELLYLIWGHTKTEQTANNRYGDETMYLLTPLTPTKHLLGVRCYAKHLSIFLPVGGSGKVSKMTEKAILWGSIQVNSDLTYNHFLWHPEILKSLSNVISRHIAKCLSWINLAFPACVAFLTLPQPFPSACSPFTYNNHTYFQIQLHLLWSYPHLWTTAAQSKFCLLITHCVVTSMWHLRISSSGLPWWRSGWESACQCRGHGFEPWSGRISHAAERLGPWATIAEPARLEPVLCNKRGHDSERPAHRDQEWPPLAATRESPRTETKTRHSHK